MIQSKIILRGLAVTGRLWNVISIAILFLRINVAEKLERGESVELLIDKMIANGEKIIYLKSLSDQQRNTMLSLELATVSFADTTSLLNGRFIKDDGGVRPIVAIDLIYAWVTRLVIVFWLAFAATMILAICHKLPVFTPQQLYVLGLVILVPSLASYTFYLLFIAPVKARERLEGVITRLKKR